LLRGREVLPRGVELFDIVLGVGFLPMRALGVELLVLGVELADPGREFVLPEVPLGERGEKLRLGEYRGVKQGALSDSSSCCSAIRAAALSTAQTVASTATRGSCRGVITNAIRGGSTLGRHRGGATIRQALALSKTVNGRAVNVLQRPRKKTGVVRVNMLRAQV
jgi:hypothetical protein